MELVKSSIVITVVVNLRNDAVWIVTSNSSMASHSRAHSVEKSVKDRRIWKCTCERALVPPLQLIGVERRIHMLVRGALGGDVEVHSVDMDAANQLVALEDSVVALEPTMAAYQQRHHAYKYQIALNVVFHKAVDPKILTDPPVTLRTTMAAVYAADVPQLVETSRHLLEFLEVYEQNVSGWVFSNFVSMELSLWHLDPFRASAFLPLPKWVRDKRAVTNVVGTGDDCIKWVVFAG